MIGESIPLRKHSAMSAASSNVSSYLLPAPRFHKPSPVPPLQLQKVVNTGLDGMSNNDSDYTAQPAVRGTVLPYLNFPCDLWQGQYFNSTSDGPFFNRTTSPGPFLNTTSVGSNLSAASEGHCIYGSATYGYGEFAQPKMERATSLSHQMFSPPQIANHIHPRGASQQYIYQRAEQRLLSTAQLAFPGSQRQPPMNQFQPPMNHFQPPINQFQAPMNKFQAPLNQFQPPINQFQAPINQFQPPMNQFQPQMNQFQPTWNQLPPAGHQFQTSPCHPKGQPSLHLKGKGTLEPFQPKSPVRHLQPVIQAFRAPEGSLSGLCERQESMNLFVSQRFLSKSRPRVNEHPRQGVSTEPRMNEYPRPDVSSEHLRLHPHLGTEYHQQMNHQWFNRVFSPQSIQQGSCPDFDIKRSNTEILRQKIRPKYDMTYHNTTYEPMDASMHQWMRAYERRSTASNHRITTQVGTSDPSERRTTTSDHMQSWRVPSMVQTFERLPPPT